MLDAASVRQAVQGRLIGRELNYQDRVGSTQDVARRAAERGAPEGFVSLADEQTSGRGRLGRTWISPPGASLHVSILLRPDRSYLDGLALIAPLAVCHAVFGVTGLEAGIKWPNDVLLNNRKLAGILIETEFRGEAVEFSVVGIGVNVNLDVSQIEEIRETATSLSAVLGHAVSREQVLIALLSHFDRLYLALRAGRSPYLDWKARLLTLGQDVTVRIADQVYEGVAEDVREDGALVLRHADGSRTVIEAGEVTLRG